MRFDILTIFPAMFDSYLNESILHRARTRRIADMRVHDIRKWAEGKHKKTDDRPYGGGPGMVMSAPPILKAIAALKLPRRGTTVILFSPAGKPLTNSYAERLIRRNRRIVLVCGRYEGIDARVKTAIRHMGFSVDEISIGPYVLTGGELPAMVLIDSVVRRLPDVIGKRESLEESRFGVGTPAYTKPETLVAGKKRYRVPSVLLSGDHKKIAAWRKRRAKSL